MAAASPITTAPAVYRVRPTYLDKVWPQVEPLFAKATARENGRLTTRNIYHWIETGEQQLWVITRQGRYLAAALVHVYRHPTGKRAATLHLLGGSGVREWAQAAFDSWVQACHLDGITEMNIVGRKGWLRYVGRFGFKPEAVILRREEV